ncbi:MAG: hypothetical protein ACFFCS_22335 [Candidatus Hodarchaeota archaeon]
MTECIHSKYLGEITAYKKSIQDFLSRRRSRRRRYEAEGIDVIHGIIIFQRARYQLIYAHGQFLIMEKGAFLEDDNFIGVDDVPGLSIEGLLEDIMILSVLLGNILEVE